MADDWPETAWSDVGGRLVPGGHVLPIRIYFEDTDFSGLVYHANYLRFMERGRSDLLRSLGIGHEELAKGVYGEPVIFAVRRIEIDYLRPAKIDDLIEVRTRPAEMRGVRLIMRQTITKGDEVLVEATVTVITLSPEGRVRRLPDAVSERFAAAQPG